MGAGVEAGLWNVRVPVEVVDEGLDDAANEDVVEADLEAAEAVVEAGVGAGVEAGLWNVRVPVEAVDEADVSREEGAAGAVNTSSSPSVLSISAATPDPAEEWTEDATDSEAGSSRSVFMSIFRQSRGKSSSLLLSKIIILSPPIDFASSRMPTGSKSSRFLGIIPIISFFILFSVFSGLKGSFFSTCL